MDEINQRRIRWKCRRGMLELDILLLNFFDRHFAQLTPQEQQLFEKLLEEEDVHLFDWLMHADEPRDPALKELIHKIAENK
jgi:antitoxin CptB